MVYNYNKEELNITTKKIYSEIYEILNVLGDSFISKLPKNLYNMLKDKRDIGYAPKYNKEKPLSEQNVNKNTITILALLHLNYWCEDEKEQQDLNKLFIQSEAKFQEEIRQKYNPDEIFNNKRQQIITNENKLDQNKEIAVYKQSIWTKVLNKIKTLFYSLKN